MTEITHHVSMAYYFSVFIFLFLSGFPDSSSAGVVENVCQSAECIDIAEKITKYMDPSISPCDDFYKFVCNKFHENKDIVPVEPTFSNITSHLAGSLSLKQNSPLHRAHKIYILCMAQNLTNQYEIETIRQVIQRIGGWPIVEGDEWHQKRWEDVVASLSQSGYYWGIFFKSVFRIYPEDSYIDVLGADLDEIVDIDDVAWVANQLVVNSSNIVEIKETIRNVSDHFGNSIPYYGVFPMRLTVGDMMVMWPSIDWMTYFTSYFANLPNININTNTNVTIDTFHVNNVVNFLATTSKEQIMNYVISRLVVELRSYFPEFVMRSDVSVHVSTDPFSVYREKYCWAVNKYSMRGIVYLSLSDIDIDEKTQDKFIHVSESMRHKMGELITQAHLDNQTLQKHQEKLFNTTIELRGYDKISVNSRDRFNDLVLNEQDFGDTLWNVVKFHHNSHVERIEIVGISSTQLLPTNRKILRNKRAIYAYHYDMFNTIIVSMDNVAVQSFQDGLPKYLNYGMVRNTIAHEIGHSVSVSEIRDFLSNSTSLDQARKSVLSSKIDCFKRLYDTYIKELKATKWSDHNVKEDVADHIGRKVAHLVYKDWLDANGPEPQLPNLNYTSMQMFWISYAHNWCDDVPELEWVNRWDTKDHSPSRYRVNMPLSNNLAFSEAFKCKPGSRMNPVDKCSYW